MNPVVAIMAQGGMGAATAERLTENGIEVRTVTAGRSAASAERAAKARMKPVSMEDLVAADFILSIVPPAQAIPLAREIAPYLMSAAKKPVYVDLNAVNPDTAMMVEMIVAPTGALFVDGGIIGGPPRPGYSPVYYVSGEHARRVEVLGGFGIKVSALDAPGCAASALKMSYAGITKGLIGVATSMILAADRAGISDALRAELGFSQAALLAGFRKSIPDMFGKAGRWVAEMEQIGGFAGGDGRGEGDIYRGLSRLYARIGKDLEADQAEIDVLRAFFPPETK